MPNIPDSYLKIGLKTALGVLVAAAVAFLLAALGTNIVPNWTGREAAGSQALARQLGVFLGAYVIGLVVLRLALRNRRGLAAYLAGGAALGLAASLLAILVDSGAAAVLPYALFAGAAAGAAGAVPVSGSGKTGPAPVAPVSGPEIG